jgi:hypothetical protein
MKSLLPIAGLLVALGGCTQLPEPSLQPSRHSQPMAAQILPRSPGVGLRFRVSRPAYAALYQIIPGAGVSQVYPAAGTGDMEGRVFAGYTSLNTVRLANIEQYSPAALSLNGPRFYFLITSDRPLDIDRFGTFGIGLRRELGLQFTGFNAYETMERIAEMTVPVPGDQESWSTDLYVEWPNVLFDAPVPGRTLVPLRCGSYRMYVPVDRVLEVDTRVCHPERMESPNAPQPPLPSDSSRPVTPRPRAPVPPAGKPAPASPRPAGQRVTNAVSERIMASAQLEDESAGARGMPQDRPARQRITEARERARPGSRSNPRGGDPEVRSGGARSSAASASAASARTATGSSGRTSSGSASPKPAAPPSPAPAPAPAPAPRTPEPSSSAPAPHPIPAPHPVPAREDANGG